MKKEEVGVQVLDLISKMTGESLEGVVNAMVEKKLETLPVRTAEMVHTIKVGSYEPKKIKGLVCREFDFCMKWVANGNNLMLTGPAGTGKGTIARQIAEAFDADFYEVNAVQNAYELTGFVDANSYYVETPWYHACKAAADGDAAVFLFDEMDCSVPEVLKIFNEGLSSREFTFPNGETLEFPNLTIICACNTFGTGADMQYCGNQLDASTLDRFAMVRIDYDPMIDLAVADGDKELVQFFAELRKVTETMNFIASNRSIARIASMKDEDTTGEDMRRILECGLFKSMSADDLEIVKTNLNRVIPENPYVKAMNGQEAKFTVKTSKKKVA